MKVFRPPESKRSETNTITKMSSKYPIDRRHVASGNRVGQRGIGEILQHAHPLCRIDFIGVQSPARGAQHFDNKRVLGPELIFQIAPEPRCECGRRRSSW